MNEEDRNIKRPKVRSLTPSLYLLAKIREAKQRPSHG